MNNGVSKSRRRQTRDRERRVERAVNANRPFKDGPLLGFLYALVCWALSLAVFTLPLRMYASTPDTLLSITGKAIAIALSLLCLRLLTVIAAPDAVRRNSRMLLLALIIFIALSSARLAHYLYLPLAFVPDSDSALFLVPFSFAPIIATLLFSGTIGLLVGLILGIMTTFLWNGDPIVLMIALLATVITVHETAGARTRSRVLRIGLMAGCMQFSAIFLQMTLRSAPSAFDISEVVMRALFSLIGGFSGALLAVLLLPAVERLFAMTSNITLMGFTDLGHPLLQRLALEAPGTYHHSLVVANLAQAAADRIGANGLLARVTSYYHDIGKLPKPSFFIENASLATNPHDELPPNISRLIIANHVKEGISLALLHKLPLPVMTIIREHHGTSVISCFHHKAREQLNRRRDDTRTEAPGETVDESHYRYAGPAPTSRESAIICLADSIEAASRSIDKVTPTHIEGLVSSIIQHKLLDGQLNQSRLTLLELTLVKRSFTATLTSMLHARIAYPKNEDYDKQPTKDSPDESPEVD